MSNTTTVYVNDTCPTRIDVATPRIEVDIVDTGIHVDVRGIGQPGSQGPPGPAGPTGPAGDGTQAFNEVPIGVCNGVNAIFTIAHMPQTGSTAVYRNGLREHFGIGYTVSGITITFSTPPLSTDDITVDYLLEG